MSFDGRTCRMGDDPGNSIVDSNGRVHSLKNVFIADGSIFPVSVGINPQVSIMAVAPQFFEFILEKYKKK